MGLLLSLAWVTVAHAADRFWVGAGNSISEVWEDTANWSDMVQGAGGSTVPGTSDIAIFSLSGSTARMRSDVTVSGIFLANTFTGSVLQGTGILTVGRDGVRVGSGRLTGGTGNMTSSGSYTQTGGIVVATQSRYTQSGSFSITDGVGSGIPKPSFTTTGTLVLAGDTQDFNAHPIFASITSLTMSGSSRATLRSAVSVTSSLQVSTGAVLTLNGFKLAATGSTIPITNYATITEGTGAIVHTASSFLIADSSYAETATVEMGQTAYFTLSEADENIDGTAFDTHTITVTTTEGDSETVTLEETSATAGIFRGSISTIGGFANTGNGRIDVKAATTLTISFTDAQDSLTNSDTATLALPTTSPASTGSSGAAAASGGGGGRTTAAIQRGELPSRSKVGVTAEKPPPVQQPVPQERPAQVSLGLQGRTCERVSRRFRGNASVLSRINQRLQKRFGFSC